MGPKDHPTLSREFRLKEFEALRREVELKLNDATSVERNVIIAVGITWAWLIGNARSVPPWAWCIPILFAVLGFLRYSAINKQFAVFHRYIELVESTFGDGEGPPGWEHYSWGKMRWVGHSSRILWGILLTSTVAAAAYEMSKR